MFSKYREKLAKDRLLVVEGEIEEDEFSGGYSVVASAIYDLEAMRERHARHILIELDCDSVDDGVAHTLREGDRVVPGRSDPDLHRLPPA